MPSLAVAASAVGLSLLLSPSTAMAVGEAVGGFPNWQERVLHQWMNRARAAPAMDLANCTAGSCGDSGCYMPIAPLPGLRIYKWRRGVWAILFTIIIPTFFLINFFL